MSIDIKLFYFFNDIAGKSFIGDALIVFLAEYLQHLVVAVLFLLLYVSFYTSREKWRIFQVVIVSIFVSRIVITELIRMFYHRLRPYLEIPANNLLTESAFSFPSGHAAFFFALAAAVYGFNKKWGIGFFGSAAVISISRIAAGVHYPSDIVGGMIIGILAAYVTAQIFKKFYNN